MFLPNLDVLDHHIKIGEPRKASGTAKKYKTNSLNNGYC